MKCFRNSFRFRSYFSIAQREERNALLKEVLHKSAFLRPSVREIIFLTFLTDLHSLFLTTQEGDKRIFLIDLGRSGRTTFVRTAKFCFRSEWQFVYFLNRIFEGNYAFLEELSIIKILNRMIVSFSHQSCLIEGNSLGSAESQSIWDRMNQDYNIEDLQHEEAQLPAPKINLERKLKLSKSVTTYLRLITYIIIPYAGNKRRRYKEDPSYSFKRYSTRES